MVAPVLVFAVGNESRGDDALAPLLLRRVEAWLQKEGRSADFELIEDFQLQVEHVMDMVGRKMILFIDAGMDTPEPYTFYRSHVGVSHTLYSHALTPEAVQSVYPQIYCVAPPPVFVLCVRGEQFELGEELSQTAKSRLELAMDFMRILLHQAELSAWETLTQQPLPGDVKSHVACSAR